METAFLTRVYMLQEDKSDNLEVKQLIVEAVVMV